MTLIGFTREAFAALRGDDRPGPVHMPNLIGPNARAVYP